MCWLRHQGNGLHCPRQNRRIKPLSGALKPLLQQRQFSGRAALTLSLRELSDGYNELRPYQNLGGRTPQKAWDNIDPFLAPKPSALLRFVQRGDGLRRRFMPDGEAEQGDLWARYFSPQLYDDHFAPTDDPASTFRIHALRVHANGAMHVIHESHASGDHRGRIRLIRKIVVVAIN